MELGGTALHGRTDWGGRTRSRQTEAPAPRKV